MTWSRHSRRSEPIHAFRERVLPRRTGCRQEFVHAHRRRRLRPPIERVIAIPEEVSRCLVPGERFAQLLGGPRRGGMVGDGDVHDAPALVRDEHQDEQQTARRRRDDEEIAATTCPM
jgi:hypothetical protein